MQHRRELIVLTGILFLGFFIRGLYLFEIINNPDFSTLDLDASFNDYWARALATGDWTVPEPNDDPMINTTPYQRFPGYPWFLATVYWFLGQSDLAARIVQMLLGTGNCLLAFFLGKKWFGSTVGLIFAWLMSFYWIFIYFEGELYATVLTVFFALLLISSLSLWIEKTGFFRCAVTGFILGFFALTRANILIFVPVVIAWFAWISYRRKNWRPFPPAVIGLLLGIIITILPITISNYVVAKDFVVISSYGGLQLTIGNNALADGVNPTIPHLKEMTGLTSWSPYEYPRIVRSLEKKLGKTLKYSEASAYWTKEAIRYIRGHPWETLKLTFRKAVLFWGPREISNPIEIHYARLNSPVLRNIPGNFPFVLSLSIAGILILFFDLKSKKRYRETALPSSEMQVEVFVLILLFIAAYFISFLPFLVSARFRAPLIPFLLLFGSYALYCIAKLAVSLDFRKLVRWLFILTVAYVLSSINFSGYEPDLARWHYHLGTAYLKKNQNDNAVKELTKALRSKPNYPEAHNNMGFVLVKQGKLDKAVRHYLEAVRINPDYAKAHNNLGFALALQNKLDMAITHYSKALQIKPDYAEAHNNLGVAYRKRGKLSSAITEFQQAIRINPKYSDAYFNLGNSYQDKRQPDMAIEEYQKTLLFRPSFADAHNNLGTIYHEKGEPDMAIAQFKKALKIKPDYARAYNNLGAVYHEKGHLDLAIKQYQLAIQIKKDSNVYYNLGNIYLLKNMPKKAKQAWEMAIKLNPSDTEAAKKLEELR